MGIADLFRPKYRHSNVKVRAEAVRQLSTDGPDAAIAINIARKDAEASIRRLAIEKIEDPDVLVDIAAGENERALRDLANERAATIWVSQAVTTEDAEDGESVVSSLAGLGDQRAIAEVASRAALTEVRDAALGQLDDPKALAELARSSKTHAAARTTAIARIDDMDVLRSIAVDEKRKDIAMAMLDRSEKTTHCPHKGDASYYSVVTKSRTLENAVWSYEDPKATVADIKDHLSFYGMDEITVERI